MKRLVLVAVTIGALLGCASKPAKPAFSWDKVNTVRVDDRTGQILLTTSKAKFVSEVFEIGLREKGYTVCTDCTGDVKLTLKVLSYKTKDDTSRSFLVGGITAVKSSEVEVEYSFADVATDSVFLKSIDSEDDRTDIEPVVGRLVSIALLRVPQASRKNK